jgi:1-acyl-sn-glycerol-3-phosphate acyltransferase
MATGAAGSINHDALPDQPSLTFEKTTSPLLALPRELRDLIYDIALAGTILKLDYDSPKPSPESLGLLLACKQMYTETIDVYYRHVIVATQFPETFTHWAQQIPRERLQQIPGVQFKCTLSDHSLYLHSKFSMTNLTRTFFRRTLPTLQRLGIELDSKEFTAEITGAGA